MSAIDRAALRRLAEVTSFEPWVAGPTGVYTVADVPFRLTIAEDIPDADDARFIAACDPPTVLALLDALDAAEARIGEADALRAALVELADAVLDRPFADPDDDAAKAARAAQRLALARIGEADALSVERLASAIQDAYEATYGREPAFGIYASSAAMLARAVMPFLAQPDAGEAP